MHPLVVALQRKLPSGDAVVVGPERHLVGGNGLYLVGDRHPEVDGQGNLRRREQMYVLRHTRVGCLGGPVLREDVLGAHSRLQRPVGFAHSVE